MTFIICTIKKYIIPPHAKEKTTKVWDKGLENKKITQMKSSFT